MDFKKLLEDIIRAYATRDAVKLRKYIADGYCKIKNKKLVFTDDLLNFQKELYEYWDQQQYIRKILLNVWDFCR